MILVRLFFLALVFVCVLPQAQAQTLGNQDCLACHSDSGLFREVDGNKISLFVDSKAFGPSVHGPLRCTDCHSDVKNIPHVPAPEKVSCAQCHLVAFEAYEVSLHAKSREQSNGSKAASCLNCHGNAHAILPSSDPQSRTYKTNIPATCGSCHGVKFVLEGSGISSQPFFSYQESVHGKAVAAGSMKAAVCTDCHKSHDIRPPGDPQSSIFKFNVPNTCAQCHDGVKQVYMRSIHGQAITRGNWQAPVCTDCHGIHMIRPHIDPNSSVASQALAKTTCAQCHEGVKLSQEFGIAGKRASFYLDSYHGLASQLGSAVVANCASCHGIHNILPSADQRSTINKANLVATCGKCHPGAGENFALGKVHLDVPLSKDIGSRTTHWVRAIYLWLIFGVIGAMLAHNVLIWRKKAIAYRNSRPRTFIRMQLSERVQHLLILTSFFVLVLTGFALKYPDSWLGWVLGSSEAFRRIGHRVAGVVMLGVGLYHVWYMLMTKRGRQGLRDFQPKWKDITGLIQNLRYYLGLSSRKPAFGRFTYGEKAEYWALVWGVVVMGSTGLLIWFKVGIFGFLPRWSVDVALAIHFYEAILATLAIFVWHFYQVFFDPDVYPMNWAWWDGKMSEEQYREEHSLAFESAIEENDQAETPENPAEGLPQ